MRWTVTAVALVLSCAASAAEPEYPHGAFSGDCQACHAPDRWRPARVSRSWKHPAAFPLTGAHRSAACRACHVSLDFAQAPTDCADCHQDVHRGELGGDCASCHRPTNFLDRTAQLDRHRATRFPLVGAHVTQDCDACHRMQPGGSATWVGLDPDCVSCHLDAYRATTTPDHEAAGFSLDCLSCHRPTTWVRASLDHDRTGFPLTGAHRTVPCAQCHTGGYAETPADCHACHAADYGGTSDPAHAAAGFPTTCATCHTTAGWDGARMPDHDAAYFPIYSGRHQGRWTRCTDCHAQPSSFSVFSCLSCHGPVETASHHGGVAGYAYDSNLCLQCHPRGQAD
jgi:hypothetical protein